MGIWDTIKRVGTGVATGGLSEVDNIWNLGKDSASQQQQRADLNQQGQAAGAFAGVGEQNYNNMTAEAQAARDYLRKLASGEQSVSAEQLRQGMQQNVNAQRSMAASAAPGNSAMAARNAAVQMGRAGAGLAGQQAVAGLQERQQAQMALNQAILGARGQDAQVGLGSRQTAIQGFGGVTPEQSMLEKWANPIAGGLGAAAKFSDKRLKEDIEDGDDSANAAMKGLRAFTYRYRDKKLGANPELGIMAQDLEKAGLKHTIIETPRGKAVHGASLATANTAMLSALEKRLSKIEKGK